VFRFFEPPLVPSDPDAISPHDDLTGADSGSAAESPGSKWAREPASDELRTSVKDRDLLKRILRNLERRKSQEFVDKGLWVLYLAVGALSWVDPQDETERIVSPLLLIPVDLRRESPKAPFELTRAEQDSATNPALAVKLEQEFGIVLPDIDDADEADPEAFFDRVRAVITEQPDWRVESNVYLASFSFHKEVMYRDLMTNEAKVANHPLIKTLSLGTAPETSLDFDPVPEADLDETVPPERSVAILDADSSQRQCMAAAAQGRSFVMDGPPGSGKSQTIANLISELIAAGKSVLFVSEKAAALEVVQARLDHAGLGSFILALHSYKATRREVARALARALQEKPVPPAGLDPIRTARLAASRRELSDYARALNEIRLPLGKTLHQVLGRVAKLQAVPQGAHPTAIGTELTAQALSQIAAEAESLRRAWTPVSKGETFLWRDLAPQDFGAVTRRNLIDLLERSFVTSTSLHSVLTRVLASVGLSWSPSSATGERLRKLRSLVNRRPYASATWLSCPSTASLRRRATELAELAMADSEMVRTLHSRVGAGWDQLEVSLGETIASAIKALRGQAVPFSVNPKASFGDLQAFANFLNEAPARLGSVNASLVELGDAFGISVDRLDLGSAAALAQLGQLASARPRPEASWLEPSLNAAAHTAVGVLEQAVRELTSRREALSELFRDEILTLDLRGMCVRFETIHRGLFAWTRGQFWRDRRALAANSVAGRFTSDCRTKLRDALSWQMAAERLTSAEESHAGVLGSSYRGSRSDFAQIHAGLARADLALALSSRLESVGTERLQRYLAGNDTVGSTVVEAGTSLGAAIGWWRAHAARSLPEEDVGRLQSQPLVTLAQCCAAAAPSVARIAESVGRSIAACHRELDLADVQECTELRRRVDVGRQTVLSSAGSDQALFGSVYKGLDTDWDDLAACLDWADNVRALLEGPVAEGVAQQVLQPWPAERALSDALDAWQTSRGLVLELFADPHRARMANALDVDLDKCGSVLRKLIATIDDIVTWQAFAEAKRNLLDLRVGAPVAFCVQNRVSADEAPRVIERAVLEQWADSVFRKDARLKALRAEDRDHNVQEFRLLDRELISAASSRVIASCNSRRPQTGAGSAGIIRREGEKQRKHMPTRELLARTHEVVQALLPCFMMSPLTVSQFLPTEMRFDAVVFDEASQVRPCDAANCIYRGAQLIVAGDQKQLPPTSFFDKIAIDGDDEWDENDLEDFESVLDICKGTGGFPSLPLRWHYRSQHEDLITFSNYSFYEGRLLTFPSAQEASADLGVELFRVDGIYRRAGARDNPVEAAAVVDRVRFHLKYRAGHTLGVVAFSEAQASAIEAELERQQERHAELRGLVTEDRLRGFFIKNLENVQGDERDVLIFSVGYGPDENGKFTLQMGPINGKGGARRLNVAITRARRRIEVVSSIGASDFHGDVGSEGIRHLKRYLDYAARPENKVRALAIDIGGAGQDVESPFEAEVARVVRSWGYDVVPQVGCAGYRVDLGVRHPEHPGTFALGIECDGASYHSSVVARDRDRLRQEILEGLGWTLCRIWSPAWYRARDEQESRLRNAIEVAVRTWTPPEYEPPSSPVLRDTDFEAVDLDAAPSWTVPYALSKPRRLSRSIEMHQPEATTELARMVEEVVKVEGPVAEAVVLRRLREAWGVRRAGSRIRDRFERCLHYLLGKGVLGRSNSFLTLPEQKLVTVRTPTRDEGTYRNADEVPPAEIRLAVRLLVQEARSIDREELTTRVARLFGWARRGADIGRSLDEAVDSLVAEGALTEIERAIKPANDLL